jgi:hypothetical protein
MITTAFTKSNLTVSRGYITYSPIDGASKFVARFKFGSPGSFKADSRLPQLERFYSLRPKAPWPTVRLKNTTLEKLLV